MSIDPTKGNSLLIFFNRSTEGVISEATIIGMIMLDADPVGMSKCLKGLFCFYGLVGS
jgi:hypothetical protein